MSNFKLQKRLAAAVAGVGKNKVVIDASAAEDLKEAITKADIGGLIRDGVIEIKGAQGTSRHRARMRHAQRKKGRQRGYRHRKGSAKARTPSKRVWINKIRLMRGELKTLRDANKLDKAAYRELYMKAKGNFFRSKKHMLLYIEQNKMVKGGKKK